MVENRIELAKRKGKEFEVRCEKCGHFNNVHVDDVKAINDFSVKIIGLISIIVAIVLTKLFWDLGFIAAASFTIPLLLISTVNKNQSNKIKQFNMLYYDSKRIKKI